MSLPPLRLFDGFGIELEYMIVDSRTLDVRPIADELLKSASGTYDTEVELGPISWSNELALHVVELKTTDPVRTLRGVDRLFQAHVERVQAALAPMGARLLPSAMHPWMDPHRELRLWPHGSDAIYGAFDRIFDCRGHGWANLQSTHVNLPFGDDAEFGRLHAAVRLALPLLPALAASSPIVDGRLSGLMDTRLEVYRHNADRVPSVAGAVIPEPLFTQSAYERGLLDRIYADLAPHDPDGTLRYEWVNARGCIARFDRHALEIRVLDVQECPAADLAVVAATVAVVRGLVAERWSRFEDQCTWDTRALARLLDRTARDAERAVLDDPAYLAVFGFSGGLSCTAGELWQHLVSEGLADLPADGPRDEPPGPGDRTGDWLRLHAREGCLARRLAQALGPVPDRDRLHEVYRRLADCLATGAFFSAGTRAVSDELRASSLD